MATKIKAVEIHIYNALIYKRRWSI